jgi:hypothetical protein
MRRYEEAQKHVARLPAEDHKRQLIQISALGNLGCSHFKLGEYRKAVLFFQQTIGAAKAAGIKAREVIMPSPTHPPHPFCLFVHHRYIYVLSFEIQ